jgi:hypothetical protein
MTLGKNVKRKRTMEQTEIKLDEFCSRKLLDMYKTETARSLKLAIKAELLKRDHFTASIAPSSARHH